MSRNEGISAVHGREDVKEKRLGRPRWDGARLYGPLVELAGELGRSPNASEYDRRRAREAPSLRTLVRRGDGGWGEVLETAGLELVDWEEPFTAEECVSAVAGVYRAVLGGLAKRQRGERPPLIRREYATVRARHRAEGKALPGPVPIGRVPTLSVFGTSGRPAWREACALAGVPARSGPGRPGAGGGGLS